MTNFNQDVFTSVSKLVPAEKSATKAVGVADKARLDTALKLAMAVSRIEPSLEFKQGKKTEIKKQFFGNPKIEGEKQSYVLTNDQIKNITKITYNPVVLENAKLAKDVSELKTLLADLLDTKNDKGEVISSTDNYRGMVSALPKQEQGKETTQEKLNKATGGDSEVLIDVIEELFKLDVGQLKEVKTFIVSLGEANLDSMVVQPEVIDAVTQKVPEILKPITFMK